MPSTNDFYTSITKQILTDLAKGIRPWHRPWNSPIQPGNSIRPLRHNGIPYSGINTLILWASASAKQFTNSAWMTFRQAQALQGQVRKGEKGTKIVFTSKIERTRKDKEGEEEVVRIPFLRTYTVFNADQIDGLPEKFRNAPQLPQPAVERISHLEEFFVHTGASIKHGGDQALYNESSDCILMPNIENFSEREDYYSTLAHEAVHWTKHRTRLHRNLGAKRWGDAGYAMEELVAELGAAFLCGDLKIRPDVPRNHADYIGSWLQVLENDHRAVFQAASYAQKAVDLLHSFQVVHSPVA